MAAGKSFCGQKLSQKIAKPFLDIDQEIETRTQMKIDEIFSRYGESYFRNVESEVFFEIIEQNPQNIVIAAGGGLVINQNNHSGLKKCCNIFLNENFNIIIQRLKTGKNNRPKIEGLNLEEIKKIFDERQKKYYYLADYTVNNCDELINLVQNLKNMDK